MVDRARDVRISDSAIEHLAARIAAERDPAPEWDLTYHLPVKGDELAQYIFVLDTCNFCFWGNPKWRIDYKGQTLDGYWAEAAALRRAVESGIPLLDAAYLAGLRTNEVAEIFAGENEIPLLTERTAALNEAGRVLQQRFQGQFSAVLREAGGDAIQLVRTVAGHFRSFADSTTYDGAEIRFYKRAQILAADVHLSGAAKQVLGSDLTGIEDLTAFADYKVPQVLRAFEVLEYSPEAAASIDNQVEIPAGSDLEIEIRAATIQAIERLRELLGSRGISRTSIEIDWLLWSLGQGDIPGMLPYHRTRTIYY